MEKGKAGGCKVWYSSGRGWERVVASAIPKCINDNPDISSKINRVFEKSLYLLTEINEKLNQLY